MGFVGVAANPFMTCTQARHQTEVDVASEHLGAFAPWCAILTIIGDMQVNIRIRLYLLRRANQPQPTGWRIFNGSGMHSWWQSLKIRKENLARLLPRRTLSLSLSDKPLRPQSCSSDLSGGGPWPSLRRASDQLVHGVHIHTAAILSSLINKTRKFWRARFDKSCWGSVSMSISTTWKVRCDLWRIALLNRPDPEKSSRKMLRLGALSIQRNGPKYWAAAFLPWGLLFAALHWGCQRPGRASHPARSGGDCWGSSNGRASSTLRPTSVEWAGLLMLNHAWSGTHTGFHVDENHMRLQPDANAWSHGPCRNRTRSGLSSPCSSNVLEPPPTTACKDGLSSLPRPARVSLRVVTCLRLESSLKGSLTTSCWLGLEPPAGGTSTSGILRGGNTGSKWGQGAPPPLAGWAGWQCAWSSGQALDTELALWPGVVQDDERIGEPCCIWPGIQARDICSHVLDCCHHGHCPGHPFPFEEQDIHPPSCCRIHLLQCAHWILLLFGKMRESFPSHFVWFHAGYRDSLFFQECSGVNVLGSWEALIPMLGYPVCSFGHFLLLPVPASLQSQPVGGHSTPSFFHHSGTRHRTLPLAVAMNGVIHGTLQHLQAHQCYPKCYNHLKSYFGKVYRQDWAPKGTSDRTSENHKQETRLQSVDRSYSCHYCYPYL